MISLTTNVNMILKRLILMIAFIGAVILGASISHAAYIASPSTVGEAVVLIDADTKEILFAKNPDKVFGKIVELTNFDVSYNNNQILMYALSNDCEGQINCESIAKVILKSFDVLLSNDNVDKIYEFILQDATTSYENVAFEIYQKIHNKNRAQRMFELLVSKSYIKVLPKILVNNPKIDVSNAILDCIEYEDTVMIEILLNYSAPSSKTLLICVKNGLKNLVYELFKKGKYGMSELVEILNSDDRYLMLEFLNNV